MICAMRHFLAALTAIASLTVSSVGAQSPQSVADEYIRYELQAPDSSRFRVVFDVAVTTAGARAFVSAPGRGRPQADVRATDRATGQPLTWAIEGLAIKVQLAKPVPAGGEARIRLEYTERDQRAYFSQGGAVVFRQPAGFHRGSVVLPAGYRLVSCNRPAQVLSTPEGRVMVSVMTIGSSTPPLEVTAKPGLAAFTPKWATARGAATPTSIASQTSRLNERAFQDREIVYFLNDPATNSFSLYHDYTESRPGVGYYFNVVRAGSRASNPSAKSLDTGEDLKVETLKGDEVKRRGLDVGEAIQADSEVVVISFPPVVAGQSTRLRISETYTDPGRYVLEGDEFVWDRAFGRPRNAVVLPAGWTAIASSIPGVVSEQADGRQRFDFDNNRPDEIQVLIRARRTR